MAANCPSKAARAKVSLSPSACHTLKDAFACWKPGKPEIRSWRSEVHEDEKTSPCFRNTGLLKAWPRLVTPEKPPPHTWDPLPACGWLRRACLFLSGSHDLR